MLISDYVKKFEKYFKADESVGVILWKTYVSEPICTELLKFLQGWQLDPQFLKQTTTYSPLRTGPEILLYKGTDISNGHHFYGITIDPVRLSPSDRYKFWVDVHVHIKAGTKQQLKIIPDTTVKDLAGMILGALFSDKCTNEP